MDKLWVYSVAYEESLVIRAPSIEAAFEKVQRHELFQDSDRAGGAEGCIYELRFDDHGIAVV